MAEVNGVSGAAPWASKRINWVEFLFTGPHSTDTIRAHHRGRDAELEFNIIQQEGLAVNVGSERSPLWSLSVPGRVLRVMHNLNTKEAGPWTATAVRDYADTRKLTADAIQGGLEHLVSKGIAKRCPTPRSVKWDLT